eukprot:606720-Rhodomonas_salina.1
MNLGLQGTAFLSEHQASALSFVINVCPDLARQSGGLRLRQGRERSMVSFRDGHDAPATASREGPREEEGAIAARLAAEESEANRLSRQRTEYSLIATSDAAMHRV